MSDDQDGCEWVSVSSGTGLPGLSWTKAVKRLCVCVRVCVCVRACMGPCSYERTLHSLLSSLLNLFYVKEISWATGSTNQILMQLHLRCVVVR